MQRQQLLSFLPASRDVNWPLSALDLIALGGGGPSAIEVAGAISTFATWRSGASIACPRASAAEC